MPVFRSGLGNIAAGGVSRPLFASLFKLYISHIFFNNLKTLTNSERMLYLYLLIMQLFSGAVRTQSDLLIFALHRSTAYLHKQYQLVRQIYDRVL